MTCEAEYKQQYLVCSIACLDGLMPFSYLGQAGNGGISDALGLISQPKQQDRQQVHLESPAWCQTRLCALDAVTGCISNGHSGTPWMSQAKETDL